MIFKGHINMKKLPFRSSSVASVGVELEFQIIDPMTFSHISKAKDLIRKISESPFVEHIKPEITQSMIEINSSIHHSIDELYEEFLKIRKFLLYEGKILGVSFSGGGTHPFQKWTSQKIFPTQRYKNKFRQFRYLSKRSAVFGQHVHVGCESADDAIYLTHALARYVPQLIAISAASPFYQGIDTGYHSSRSNVFNAFPLSGVIPYLTNWGEFSEYYYKMRRLKIIDSMKDIYWDIRPKPEFGTVEIRVCDTPLDLNKAAVITAYIQSLARYLLLEKPALLSRDLYYLYSYNRFQASRYGLEGEFIHPINFQHKSIRDDILETIALIEKHTLNLNNAHFVAQLSSEVEANQNDAVRLRKIFTELGSLPQVVHEQCEIWKK